MVINNKNQDPYAQREASRYEYPVPSREFILEYLQQHSKPVTREKLIEILKLTTEDEKEGLRRRLRAMERDGQVVFKPGRGYSPITEQDLITGEVIGHKDGYGFVVPEDGSDDLFLSARQMRAIFDGDRVAVREIGLNHRGRREATLVEILQRNTQQVVGRFFKEESMGYVVPDNKRISQDIIIPPGNEGAARHGQIVMATIVTQPTFRNQALGRIVEILGEHMAPGMEIDVAIRSHELPYQWSENLLRETAQLDMTISSVELAQRVDLRHLPFVTIDGEDAQDFDDAVYCEPRPREGWTLYVAIADVSHYVLPSSQLDHEAYRRGNSVYFPGQVIPMLPEILSNELCSLKPEVDRLAMVCEAQINNKGVIARSRFYAAVIHSHARLTYTQVAAMLQGHHGGKKRHLELLPYLKELHNLYSVLRNGREIRGAIDFDTVETQVIFGKDRKIEQIIPVVRNDAHRMIEECMLVANVAAARFLSKQEIPILFRVHSGPTVEKLLILRQFLGELGLSLGGGKIPKSRDYAKLLASISQRPDAHLIQTVLLRSLSQAEYSPHNQGHFGLAFDAYVHFTSPIRRYPDLLIHRAIRHVLQGRTPDVYQSDETVMEKYGVHCSLTERRADEATRDALDWLKCEYMLDQVGKEFKGIITSVTGFGIFIELQDIYVEGLLHVTALKDDYYQYDSMRHRLHGQRSGTIYRLGDEIRVRVARVDLDEKKIDFALVETKSSTAKKSAKFRKANKKSKVKIHKKSKKKT